jgi:pimeloyl-ACP methyl ester carboxylesterase
MRSMLWSASGEGFPDTPPAPIPAAGNGLLDAVRSGGPVPDQLPEWLTEDDLDTYVAQFERSGFFGPISWYRNLDADHQLVKDLPFPSIPTGFIAGTRDLVIANRPGYVESMEHSLPDHRRSVLLEGIGHWTQQEAPEEFNSALLAMIGDLDPSAATSH